ncbi:MAG TPA: siroheme synthase CysG [Steroidobacteraceae bacterium]|jgi:uroporphyrin-III C-methyltransferase/precorrin-2 dehydrogenase/sirohydrochlorin ferrochelatase
MDYLPVFLQLRSAHALIVGGGRIAARKADLLLRAGARVTVVAPRLHEELSSRTAAGELTHLAETFVPAHLDGAVIAIAATGLRDVNEAVAQAARERHVPVNVVDDASLSTFIFPAIIDRSPVLVAVGSAGQAPVLARWVREQIEAILPASLGVLARFMGERRRGVQRALAAGARRAFWERIVRGKAGTHLLAGDEPGARRAFEAELLVSQLTTSAATGGSALGEVYLIGAGPGDPDLLTLRALQLLQQADVVLYDRLVPAAVLERARREARRIFVGKSQGEEQTAQEQIHELMTRLAREGRKVARLKGGDPFIFGRGGEEAEALARAGIPYLVVPGITAALGAAAAAGIPLTQRGLAQSVTFVTGHIPEDDSLDWQTLARAGQTVVFYMGVGKLVPIVARLRAAGASDTLAAALVERATLPEQRVLRGTLAQIAGLGARAGIAPPALLIVGEVVGASAATEAAPMAVPPAAETAADLIQPI